MPRLQTFRNRLLPSPTRYPTSYGRDGLVQEGTEATAVAARTAGDSAGRLGEVRGCGHTDIREKFVKALNVCPDCDYHRRIARRGLRRAPPRRRHDGGALAPISARPTRSASSTIRTAWRRPRKKAGDADAHLAGTRQARRAAGQPRRHGLRLHGRLDGLGRGREDRAARPAVARAEDPAGHRSRASGGARMQEGVLSLMQMAKTSAALAAARRAPHSRTSRSSPIPRRAA